MLDRDKLLAAALEYPPGEERAEFVIRATEGRTELREEIQRLLRIHDDAGSFLEMAAWERDSTLVSPEQLGGEQPGVEQIVSQLEPAGSLPGLGKIGHFRLIELIGEGGSAFVFRAVDEKLNRDVAIKILRPGLASTPRHQKKFIEEAKTIAGLRAERIVSIYEVGEFNSLPFFVMEYLPKGSLQAHLSQIGPLSLDETLIIARQVAEGLAIAHDQGILHRDIKPSNVLIDRFPDRIKLSDFGLARSVLLEDEDRAIGTPQFSSPEQIRGEVVDQRTDLFGFGCLLYSLLVGQSPFAGTSRLQTIEMTLKMAPEPLKHFGVDVPLEFQELLDRLLAKDPALRPRNVLEAKQALDSIETSSERNSVNRRDWLLKSGALVAGGGLLLILARSLQSEKRGPILPSSAPINLTLLNGGLAPFLHSSENVTLVTSEPLTIPKANHYWRPTQLGKTGAVTYRFEFDQPPRKCRIKCWVFLAYAWDARAWARVWVGSDENRLQLAANLTYDRFEYWPTPGNGSSVPLIGTEDGIAFHGPRKWINVTGAMKGNKTLFIRGELHSEHEILTDAGVSLGPATTQFLRVSDGRQENSPLTIEPEG